MAERRMFAKTIIDSDSFLDLPMSSQCLYFHLNLRADDEGFINNPKRIQRMIGASDDDLKLLFMKNFVIPFESGVVVIKHWKIHNYIQKDRFKPTVYTEEKAMLTEKENKAYTLCIQDGYTMDTQDRLEIGKSKDRLNILYSLVLKDGSEYPITEDDLKGWEKNFPSLDVRNEFLKMQSWCESNPSKRKTKTGIKRFINGWLSKVRPLKVSDYEEVLPNWMTQQEEELPEWMTPEMREEWQRMKTSKKQTTS